MTVPAIYKPFPNLLDWFAGEFDASGFDKYAHLLAQSRAKATPEALDAALSAATRYAAVDTGAIEGLYTVDRGFTRTVATQSAAWESALESRGQHVREAFEDALSAYEYVLDAATSSVQISEVWIRELHSIVCNRQETFEVMTPVGPQEQLLPKGVYKTMPNSPTLTTGHEHAYAPVADTGPEMYRLMQELRSEEFLSAHPIIQAAYAHYAYVCIHPFSDGNGRVARALASVYLYRSPGVPLVVFADQRNAYFDALELADKGSPAAFIGFIGERTIDAIGIIRSSIQRSNPPVASAIASLKDLFNANPDKQELHAAAARLRNMAVVELKKQIEALDLPSGIETQCSGYRIEGVEMPAGYEDIGKDGSIYVLLESKWPRKARLLKNLSVAVAASPGDSADLILVSNPDDGLEVWQREVAPMETETLKLKLTNWVEGFLAEMVGEFAVEVATE